MREDSSRQSKLVQTKKKHLKILQNVCTHGEYEFWMFKQQKRFKIEREFWFEKWGRK